MAGPLLSICIPTYNRAARLSAAVHSLVALANANGLAPDLEICISDNASSDDTERVLDNLRASAGVALTTARLPVHQNFAHNCLNVVKLAKGEYVALCGDDDPFLPDGIDALFAAIGTGADVILLNSHPTNITKTLPPRLAIGSPVECVTKLGIFHASFIGNLVVKREQFLRQFTNELLYSAYPHYAVVMRALKESGGVYLDRATVRVDDRLRGWRAYQPMYTAIDMARLQTEDVLTPPVSGRVTREVYLKLCRSLPRALLTVRTKQTKPLAGNPYADLGWRNVLDCYRRARDIQVLVALLWLAGRLAPLSTLRLALLARDKLKAAIGLGGATPIQNSTNALT